MDVTVEPPGTLADESEQGSDDFFAAGWAARGDLSEAVAAALPEAMRARLAVVAELGHRLVLAEKQRDEALGAAHRYETASIRLSVENRALRERVEGLTRANQARSARVVLGSWARRAGWSR